MAIKLSDLQKATRKISLNFQGETLEVEYRLNVITPAFLRAELKLHEQLEKAVARWDLVDDNGNEIPVSLEVMDHLPTQLQAEMIAAITEDMRVASEEAKNA